MAARARLPDATQTVLAGFVLAVVLQAALAHALSLLPPIIKVQTHTSILDALPRLRRPALMSSTIADTACNRWSCCCMNSPQTVA